MNSLAQIYYALVLDPQEKHRHKTFFPELARMEDDFTITVTYNNKEHEFIARLRNYGYSYKIEVDLEDTKVLFEPDEERNWRALISYEEALANKKLDPELLKEIAAAIDQITH